jgi:hypothetical protein
MKSIYILLAIFFGIIELHAQESKPPVQEHKTPLNTGYLSVGLGLGMTSFNGDLDLNQGIIFTSRFKTAYHAYVEKRFGKVLGVSLQGTMGKLSENQKSINSNLNFETKFQQVGLNVSAHFDWNGDQHIAPFISAGASYMMFQPYTDILNENGTPYYYWSDGSIRNLSEFDDQGNLSQQNLANSKIITRDYDYETELNTTFDSSVTNNYKKNTLVFPVTAGVKMKLFEFLEARLSATYNVTQSDFIDNYKEGGNDAFFYGAFSMHYTIGKKYIQPKEKHYENVNFASIEKEDQDGDGVIDIDDRCANTKKGIPVDKYGCPMDDDQDGVPNYKDKEVDTKANAHVDGQGRTIKPEDFAKLDSIRKGIYVVRSARLNESPSDETLRELGIEIEQGMKERGGPKSALPNKFLFADLSDDGIIQSSEISHAIDMFFSGEVDITVNTIMDLIDYFFEQY